MNEQLAALFEMREDVKQGRTERLEGFYSALVSGRDTMWYQQELLRIHAKRNAIEELIQAVKDQMRVADRA